MSLVAAGAARIVEDRGPLAGIPKEIRVGAAEIERAYSCAQGFGFVRLSLAFERVVKLCDELTASATAEPAWMRGFVAETRRAAEQFDSSPLGASRPVFKKSVAERLAALRGAWGVSRGWDAWERVVSERIFRDSKRLGTLRALVIELLVRADPEWNGVPPDEPDQVLEAYGVRRKPGLIRCAGSGSLRLNGRTYELVDFEPTAHLPDAWSHAWVEAVADGLRDVTLIENEFPFLSYVEQSGGTRALGSRGELVVYVAGFPTPGLVEALRMLSARAPETRWRHWGDADVGGVRIWWFLRKRLGRPLEWFRSTATWLEGVGAGGIEMSAKELGALDQLATTIRASAVSDADDVRSLLAFIETLRRIGRRVEQERY